MPRATLRRGHTGGARRCAHVAGSVYVEQSSTTACLTCRDRGERWVALWLCLSCGWVACSDDSPNQHARAHYEETDHPVAVRLPRGSHPRWCYVHQRAV
jgi:uncharacterized UBP type Zn finger protein